MKNRNYSNIRTNDQIKEELQNPDFFLNFSKEILGLIEKTLDPFEGDCYTYNLNQSTIVGLHTKIFKYVKLMIKSFEEDEYETISLLSRPIYEAFVIMKYLIKKGEKSQRHFRLISYNRRYKNYKELQSIEGIGEVMVDKFQYAMRVDGFELEEFEKENTKEKGRKWCLDGKNFSEIHKEVEISNTYSYLYGMLSEVVHSGWGEIRQLHLTRYEGGFFIPKMDFYKNVDIRTLTPVLSMIIEGSKLFLEWAERVREIEVFDEYERLNKLISLQILENYKTDPDKYKHG